MTKKMTKNTGVETLVYLQEHIRIQVEKWSSHHVECDSLGALHVLTNDSGRASYCKTNICMQRVKHCIVVTLSSIIPQPS